MEVTVFKTLVCALVMFSTSAFAADPTDILSNWGKTHQAELTKFFHNNPKETSYFRWVIVGHNKYTMIFPAPARSMKEGCFETAQAWQKGFMPGDMHVNDDCA